jgi:hypothetical protein
MTPRGVGPDAPWWRKEAHDQLVAALTEAFRRAGGDTGVGGELSMRTLAKICNCSTSTVSRALSGKALPSRSVLKQLVDQLGRRGGLDQLQARRIMSLHEQITTGHTPMPAHGEAAGGVTACPTCGAAVIDRRRHIAWNWSMNNEAAQSARFLGSFGPSPDKTRRLGSCPSPPNC